MRQLLLGICMFVLAALLLDCVVCMSGCIDHNQIASPQHAPQAASSTQPVDSPQQQAQGGIVWQQAISGCPWWCLVVIVLGIYVLGRNHESHRQWRKRLERAMPAERR